MVSTRWSAFLVFVLVFTHSSSSQNNRVRYNEQSLFLSGANMAWVNFASDVGPGNTDFAKFGDIMLQMHDHGGNALRWWVHTNGAVTPEFNDAGIVTGPGTGTIQDMKTVLDLAWEREIGVKICLWSFDMLSLSNSAAVRERNTKLLTDTNSTRSYINNCLIPMIDSLKGHPAIIAWEIFNEPEGMSNEFGWSAVQHIPMSAIQRFVNLCAGAIHRVDGKSLVTSGSWAFYALTDMPTGVLPKIGINTPRLNETEKLELETRFAQKYHMAISADEIQEKYLKAASAPNYNYYRDDRLKATGGDSAGTLDFYSVHYYDWGGTAISPFHRNKGYWDLGKPLVVAEFAVKNTFGVMKENLYDTLYNLGYAGALAWSWTDAQFSSGEDMLGSMQRMWDEHKADVDVNGIGGDWPLVAITSPVTDTTFSDTAQVTIRATASDTDGSIARVEFFVGETVKIGEATVPPYTMIWKKPTLGINVLTAVATDNQAHQRTSNRVVITIGKPTKMHLEAENAVWQGTGITVKSDVTASGGAYLDMAAQTGSVTWTISGVPNAGTYECSIGYKLFYATPKTQYVNVNGARATTVVFDGASTSTWYEKSFSVPLVPGSNTIQMELSWGWMYVDYLGVPASLFATPVTSPVEQPLRFALQQNYPNPFNPVTTIGYSLADNSLVTIKVYDVVGREVATLVDGRKSAGNYSTKFDGSNVSSGVYLYRITAASGQSVFAETKRFVLMK